MAARWTRAARVRAERYTSRRWKGKRRVEGSEEGGELLEGMERRVERVSSGIAASFHPRDKEAARPDAPEPSATPDRLTRTGPSAAGAVTRRSRGAVTAESRR